MKHLAIVEPDDPSAQVRIRVVAFEAMQPKVLRDVLTTVPQQPTSKKRRASISVETRTGRVPCERSDAIGSKIWCAISRLVYAESQRAVPTCQVLSPEAGCITRRAPLAAPVS